MCGNESLNERIREYLSEHPDSEAADLLKEAHTALSREFLGGVTHGLDLRKSLDEAAVLGRIYTELSSLASTRLCAACQERVRNYLGEEEAEI